MIRTSGDSYPEALPYLHDTREFGTGTLPYLPVWPPCCPGARALAKKRERLGGKTIKTEAQLDAGKNATTFAQIAAARQQRCLRAETSVLY